MPSRRLAGVTSTERLRKCILEIHRIKGTLHEKLQQLRNENNAIPLSEIKEANKIINDLIQTKISDSKASELEKIRIELDLALRGCKLIFVEDKPIVDENDPERMKYKKRMEMLRLKAEELKYRNLTQNLVKTTMDDDKSNKSMMYASSIGLNMIVAPISFGVFVYIFAGQFINFEDGKGGRKVQAKRVIAAVMGGVLMLFVEMTLYVIRSHQLDEHTRKKRAIPPKPFGHYSKDINNDYPSEIKNS